MEPTKGQQEREKERMLPKALNENGQSLKVTAMGSGPEALGGFPHRQQKNNQNWERWLCNEVYNVHIKKSSN